MSRADRETDRSPATGAGSLRLLALAVFLAALVAGPAGAAAQTGTYHRPLGNDPATLDPARIADVYSRSVAQQLFDGLVQFDQTLTIGPALARHWRASRDGRVWTFSLRRGVRFHHGRELTSEDVVYSLTRLLDPRTKSGAAETFGMIEGAAAFRQGRARAVSGLVAVDRHTVQITLDPAAAHEGTSVPFVSLLAVGHAKILPRDLVEKQGDAFGAHPTGTGPFRFVRWERGKELVLAANPDYYDGAPRLARIVYRLYPGGGLDAMYEDFKRGELEDAPVPSQNYRRVIDDPAVVYVKRPNFSVRFYGFNTRTPPLDDRRVRRALAHAIDRDRVVDQVFLGRYTPARGVLPPGTLSYNPGLRGIPHDPARARELLREAGHASGGLQVTIWSSVNHAGILQEHELVRRALDEVGVRAEFRYLTDWPVYSQSLTDGKAPVFLYAWFADVPHPDHFLYALFHSRSPRNLMRYANPAVDALLQDARREADPLRQVDLYRRAEQLVVDDAPIVPIWHYTYERLFQRYVRGVEVSGLGDPYIPLRKVWMEERR